LIEIDQRHRDAAAAALGLLDRLPDPLVQQAAIGQSRQRIEVRLLLNVCLDPTTFGDVLDARSRPSSGSVLPASRIHRCEPAPDSH
jgi:hypothetical protein